MAGLQIPVETKGAERNLKNLAKGFDKVGDEAEKAEKEVKGFKKAMKATRGGLSKIINSLTGLKAAIIGLMGSLALGGLARSFLKAKTTSEGFNVRLKILLGSAEAGAEIFRRMSEFAGKVPFQFEEIMESAVVLSGVMKGGVDEVDQWMPLIGDLAAATGLSIQDTTGQVVRMYSAGAAAADMFRERGVLSMLGFKAGVKVTVEDTRKRLMEAWKDPASQFAGATDAIAKTWGGMMSMIGDKWFEFRNLVMDAGVFDYLMINLKSIVDFLSEMKERGDLAKWAEETGTAVVKAFDFIAKAVGFTIDTVNGLRMTWMGLKSAFHLASMAILNGLSFLAEQLGIIFDALDDKTAKIGELMATYGKWTASPAIKKFGEYLQTAGAGAADDYTDLAEATSAMADEAERAMMAESEKLVVLASQESYYKKAVKWTDKMHEKLRVLKAEREKAKGKEYTPPTLIPEEPISPEVLKSREKFKAEYDKLTLSSFQLETQLLDETVAAYEKAGIDKTQLMEYEALRREEILVNESERSLAEHKKLIEAEKEGFRTLTEDLIALSDTIDNTFVDGFSNAFTEFITGSKSAKQAFSDFAISFTTDIIQMIVKQTILNALQSTMGAAGGGIWGGLIQGGMAAVQGMADGGNVYGGRDYIVGERGPERFVSDRGASSMVGANGPEAFSPGSKGRIEPNGAAAPPQVSIANIIDPSLLTDWANSSDGKDAIMNVILSTQE